MIGFTSHLLIFGRKLSGGGGGGEEYIKKYIFAGGYLFRTLET